MAAGADTSDVLYEGVATVAVAAAPACCAFLMLTRSLRWERRVRTMSLSYRATIARMLCVVARSWATACAASECHERASACHAVVIELWWIDQATAPPQIRAITVV
jgi:hypothetical protein